jgi:cytochrome P450
VSAPRRYEEIPGPRGVPFFGNAFQFDKRRVHEQFAEWVQEYGPYVRLRIGPRDLFLVADHAVIGSVLRDRPAVPAAEQPGEIAREMGFEEGLFFANDAVWKRQRRMVMAALDPGTSRPSFHRSRPSWGGSRVVGARRQRPARSSTCRPT